MSDYVGFEPSTFSDEDLTEKLTIIQNRLFAAYSMGMSAPVQEQLRNMSLQIEFEMANRHALAMQKMWDAQFPDVIETEPDLKKSAEAAKDAKAVKNTKVDRPSNAPKFNKVYRK